MRPSTRFGTLVGATVLCLALAACSSDGSGAPGSPGSTSSPGHGGSSTSPSARASAAATHDAADVSFAQDMTAHHRGAVEMAQLATTRASTPQVVDLARRIDAAQGPEIDEMTGWLQGWGEPTTATGSMAGMHHSPGSASSDPTGSATGMMADEQMDQLRAATGTAFDRMFLQMMTTHHQGAIEMARTEQTHGSDPRAVALARSVETSQTAEVAEMGRLLAGLGS